jgi:hypothetical protein
MAWSTSGRPPCVDSLPARLQNAVRFIGQAKSGGGTAAPPKTEEGQRCVVMIYSRAETC